MQSWSRSRKAASLMLLVWLVIYFVTQEFEIARQIVLVLLYFVGIGMLGFATKGWHVIVGEIMVLSSVWIFYCPGITVETIAIFGGGIPHVCACLIRQP